MISKKRCFVQGRGMKIIIPLLKYEMVFSKTSGELLEWGTSFDIFCEELCVPDWVEVGKYIERTVFKDRCTFVPVP